MWNISVSKIKPMQTNKISDHEFYKTTKSLITFEK